MSRAVGREYAEGQKVSNAQMEQLNIECAQICAQWNGSRISFPHRLHRMRQYALLVAQPGY